jgi:hypothetical protein
LLGIAYAASLGGVGTPVGTPQTPNPKPQTPNPKFI